MFSVHVDTNVELGLIVVLTISKGFLMKTNADFEKVLALRDWTLFAELQISRYSMYSVEIWETAKMTCGEDFEG